jgi:hypothetical protein
MASIENRVLDLEEEYNRVKADFEKYVYSLRQSPNSNIAYEEELQKLLKAVVGFQRRVEYDLELAYKDAKEKKYYPRLSKIGSNILEKLNSEKEVQKISKYMIPYVDWLQEPSEAFKVGGVVPYLKNAFNYLISSYWDKSKFLCSVVYAAFRTISVDLPEFEADMRLVGWLTTFPSDKKMDLKNKLSTNGFQEVIVSLEQAESNFEDGTNHEGHRRDCINHCRDAIENFVATVRVSVADKKTDNKFSLDNQKLVDIGLYDEETGRLARGVYAFCSSDKGKHKFKAPKITVDDCIEAMQETYLLLEILLRNYLAFEKA